MRKNSESRLEMLRAPFRPMRRTRKGGEEGIRERGRKRYYFEQFPPPPPPPKKSRRSLGIVGRGTKCHRVRKKKKV